MSSYAVKGIPLEEEFKKNTGIRPDDIAMLRQWLNTQPHLPREHITDLDLILIYHKHDRSMEVSKQALDLQYTLRTLFTSFFQDRHMYEKLKPFLIQCKLVTILPTRTPEGYTVFYGRMLDSDPNKFDFAAIVRGMLMVLDLWQYEEGTWPGFIFLFDLSDLKMGIMTKLDLQTIQQFVAYFPEGLLVKFKGVHYINGPPFMDRFKTMMKTFMTKAFLDFVVIHPAGTSTLEEVIDLAALPKEAGGSYKSLEECKNEILAKFEANKDFFAEESKKRVLESFRPGKPKTITDLFGSIEGSFKQLQID